MTDGDELAIRLARVMIERRDVKATQNADGSYCPDQDHTHRRSKPCPPEGCPYRKFTMGDLRAHLAGERTFGHYLVSPEGNTRLFAYDLDLNAKGLTEEGEEYNPREAWRQVDSPHRDRLTRHLRFMAEGLATRVQRELGVPVAVSYSGNKGLHVYGLMALANGLEPVTATDARAAGIEILESWGCFELIKGKSFYKHAFDYPDLSIEVFPKQTEVAADHFGNLLRLPLGIHQKTGQPGFFLDLSRPPNELQPADPMLALQGDPWATR